MADRTVRFVLKPLAFAAGLAFAIGYVSFMLMAPLALTSTAGMIRRLGGRRWQAVHRLVYPAAIAGVVHTYWPWTAYSPRYAVVLGTVLAVRLARAYMRRPVATSDRITTSQGAWR